MSKTVPLTRDGTKKAIHVLHATGLPRGNMAVRRLGGRRIRKPRGDGPSEFMGDHDVSCARDIAIARVLWLRDAPRRRLALGAGESHKQVHLVGHAPAEVLVEGREIGRASCRERV